MKASGWNPSNLGGNYVLCNTCKCIIPLIGPNDAPEYVFEDEFTVVISSKYELQNTYCSKKCMLIGELKSL